jgi:histidinol phosphatase-like enzyme
MFARKIQRLDTVARPNGRITMRLEKIVKELHVELVVFHNQDGLGHPPFPSSLCRRKLEAGKNQLAPEPAASTS